MSATGAQASKISSAPISWPLTSGREPFENEEAASKTANAAGTGPTKMNPASQPPPTKRGPSHSYKSSQAGPSQQQVRPATETARTQTLTTSAIPHAHLTNKPLPPIPLSRASTSSDLLSPSSPSSGTSAGSFLHEHVDVDTDVEDSAPRDERRQGQLFTNIDTRFLKKQFGPSSRTANHTHCPSCGSAQPQPQLEKTDTARAGDAQTSNAKPSRVRVETVYDPNDIAIDCMMAAVNEWKGSAVLEKVEDVEDPHLSVHRALAEVLSPALANFTFADHDDDGATPAQAQASGSIPQPLQDNSHTIRPLKTRPNPGWI